MYNWLFWTWVALLRTSISAPFCMVQCQWCFSHGAAASCRPSQLSGLTSITVLIDEPAVSPHEFLFPHMSFIEPFHLDTTGQ